jgi:hypothetical protein
MKNLVHMFLFFIYLPLSFICCVYIYIYIPVIRWRFKSLSAMQWTILYPVSTFEWSWHIPLFYFIILNSLYCAETSNTVLDRMIDVHFCVDFTFWFLKMWLFPYPYEFCNSIRIYGKKINDMILFLWSAESPMKIDMLEQFIAVKIPHKVPKLLHYIHTVIESIVINNTLQKETLSCHFVHPPSQTL